MKHLSLCSGIGGFDLAAEQAGFENIACAETNEFCSKLLKKHFPELPNLGDITKVPDYIWRKYKNVDVISAGLPCQPFSIAGKVKGDSDERYLVSHFVRIISITTPKYIIFENVPHFFRAEHGRWSIALLKSLSEVGYNGFWQFVSACDIGFTHRRERGFALFTYAHSDGLTKVEDFAGKYRATQPGPLKEKETIGDEFGIAYGHLYGKEANASFFRNAAWVPSQLDCDRVKALGNSLVPQIAYCFFETIKIIEEQRI